MLLIMAIPVMEFQVRGYKISFLTKDECVQRKVQFLLKWNDGMVLKMPNFHIQHLILIYFSKEHVLIKKIWVDFFNITTIFMIATF